MEIERLGREGGVCVGTVVLGIAGVPVARNCATTVLSSVMLSAVVERRIVSDRFESVEVG
jgi:hypothetical protein